MSQPTGYVLGTRYRHPTILRSSPIICICDAINVVVSTICWMPIVLASNRKMSARRAATRVLMYRFANNTGYPDMQAIKTLKAQTTMRWVGFTLGALPQFIKLFASKGVPLSQAFGAMYLASWVVFEVLILLAELPDDHISASWENSRLLKFRGQRIQEIGAIFAILLNAIIYSLPAWSMWRNLLDSTAPEDRSGLDMYFNKPAGFIALCISLWAHVFRDAEYPSYLSYQIHTLNSMGVAAHFGIPVETLWKLHPGLSWIDIVKANGVVTGIVHAGSVGASALILIMYKPSFTRRGADLLRGWTLFFQPLWFYTLVYDSAGTYQPQWLQWLG
ncbi:hypothetical protein BJX99DRAFT_262265 [Aspergillus californicus]